jgi:shikimate kinase
MKIFLIGLMGCGKSYLGKLLAEKLGFAFVDLDSLIQSKEQATIPQIFENQGETYFRKIESECLHDLRKWSELVVATGGGAPCFHDNMDWMNENGVTIYLDTDIDVLITRLLPETDKRPLLRGKSESELHDFLENMLAQRVAFYNRAFIKIHQKGNEQDIIFEVLEKILIYRMSLN